MTRPPRARVDGPTDTVPVRVPVPAPGGGRVELLGDLTVPPGASGLVLFAHGSGSSRHSPRNTEVARTLQEHAFGTLLLDLLTEEEERVDAVTRELRFDIHRLADRLVATVDWLGAAPATRALPVGLFGASTGATAALVAAAERPRDVAAVVSRGGRPDLAGAALGRVRAPTLLVVGGADPVVLELNRRAAEELTTLHHVEVVPDATHLFAEEGALEEVARLAGVWFTAHLAAR